MMLDLSWISVGTQISACTGSATTLHVTLYSRCTEHSLECDKHHDVAASALKHCRVPRSVETVAMAVARDRIEGGSGAMATPSVYASCWSRPDEESMAGLEQEQSRIESLLESLSDVGSLTIMSPKSNPNSADITPEHSAIDSMMLVNKVFNDNVEEAPRSSDSIDSGLISRHLRPIKTRSCMGSETPASSTPEISPLTDGPVPRPRSLPLRQRGVPGASPLRQPGKNPSQHSSLGAVRLYPNADSSRKSTKPPRFGERLHELRRATGQLLHSPRRDHPGGQRSFHSEPEGFHSIPNTPETQPESATASARGFGTPRAELSPRDWGSLDHELTQEPTIEEQTEVLYACIQAMEAELQAHDLELPSPEHPKPGMVGPASGPASLGFAAVPPPHPLSSSETLAKAVSAGHSVVITGAATSCACLLLLVPSVHPCLVIVV